MDWMKLWRKTYRTMAQTLAGVLAGTTLFWTVDWKVVISTTLMSGLICFLMGIADSDNADFSEEGDVDFVDDPEDDELTE